jgi:outer membrane protein TolC
VARAEAAVIAAKAALLAHERELWPTVGLGVQAQIDDASTGFAYGRLSLSLPRVDGDPRGRAELVARVHLAEAELIELRRARAERLSTAHHEVEHQQHTLQLVEEALVPAAIARREVAEKRHALGAGEVFELVAAARAEHEAGRRAALARVGVARARVTLALLDPGHLDAHGPDGTADHEGHAGHHDDDAVIPSPVQPQEPR